MRVFLSTYGGARGRRTAGRTRGAVAGTPRGGAGVRAAGLRGAAGTAVAGTIRTDGATVAATLLLDAASREKPPVPA